MLRATGQLDRLEHQTLLAALRRLLCVLMNGVRVVAAISGHVKVEFNGHRRNTDRLRIAMCS